MFVLFIALLLLSITALVLGICSIVDDEPLQCIVSFVVAGILIMVMLFNSALMNKDKRFVPEIGVVASINEPETVGLHNIPADTPFYLQIKVSIKSKGFFSHRDIPLAIAVSSFGISTFSEPQTMQYCVETAPVETAEDMRVYHYSVVADPKPQTAYITFKVTPNAAGTQIIKFTFGKEVSAIYNKTVSLEYKDVFFENYDE